MNLKGQTLEEYFKKQQLKKFPFDGRVDYKGRYWNIKNYMDNNIHPLVELAVYKKDGYQLTKHGTIHIDNVIKKASELLDIEGINLSPYEIYILLVAIQIHDSGHLLIGREKHEKALAEIIAGFGKLIGDETAEKNTIFHIAEAHGGVSDDGDKDKITLLGPTERILQKPVNKMLLASVLRLADELSDDFTRTIKGEDIEKGSEVFHKYASVLHNVEIDHPGNQIKLSYCLEKENVTTKYGKKEAEVFLIDEIFERVFKTYLETRYCQMFFTHPIKIDTVFAKIEFIDKDSLSNFFKPISLKLSEKGYPKILAKNVYEMCPDDLKINGNGFVNGELIKQIVETR